MNFLVIAFSIYVVIQAFEKAKRKMMRQEAIAEEETPDPAIVAQERLTNAVERLTTVIETRGNI